MADLIDRQAMMNAINAYGWLSIDGKARCNEVLYSLPSVDAEPIRHGRWERRGYALWTCNLCGCRVARSNPLKGSIWNYNYCPNCGAKMDEVNDG